MRPSIGRIHGRIAVSAVARHFVERFFPGDYKVIPNGVDTRRFAPDGAATRWTGTPERPTLAFLGRLDEPRKGLAVLLEAMPAILDSLLKEDSFYDRLREGFNDIFLTLGIDGNADATVLAYEPIAPWITGMGVVEF